MLTREAVLTLIIQHLQATGLATAAKILQEEAKFTCTCVPSVTQCNALAADPGGITAEGSPLLPLLLMAVKDANRIFEADAFRTCLSSYSSSSLNRNPIVARFVLFCIVLTIDLSCFVFIIVVRCAAAERSEDPEVLPEMAGAAEVDDDDDGT